MRGRAAAGALALLLPVGLACAGDAPGALRRSPCDGKVTAAGEREDVRFVVGVQNDCHVPVVLVVSFELDNLAPSRALPVRLALPAGGSAHVVDLTPLRRDLPSSYRLALQVTPGGEPQPDPAARYAFPFGGETPRVLSQGIDGAETHHGIHRYSFDFDLPVGTPVLAARDGIVFQVQDGYGEGGLRESAEHGNLVVVWHEDGTFALYGHLQKGVCAREGDALRTGDLLGWSGSSGYTSGPHLHFSVGTAAGAAGEVHTLPIVFVGEIVPAVGRAFGPTAARGAPPGSRCDAADARDS